MNLIRHVLCISILVGISSSLHAMNPTVIDIEQLESAQVVHTIQEIKDIQLQTKTEALTTLRKRALHTSILLVGTISLAGYHYYDTPLFFGAIAGSAITALAINGEMKLKSIEMTEKLDNP